MFFTTGRDGTYLVTTKRNGVGCWCDLFEFVLPNLVYCTYVSKILVHSTSISRRRRPSATGINYRLSDLFDGENKYYYCSIHGVLAGRNGGTDGTGQ